MIFVSRKRIVLYAFFFLCPIISHAQRTERIYLSGIDADNPKEWDFFCTAGRQSGVWSKISVPSCWEQEGYGTYNYGHDADEIRGKEKGIYRMEFDAPAEWKSQSVRIVFEGSMTDTEVKINGMLAGPVHQGGFYRFSYDITNALKWNSKNQLEVTVSKHSANASVNNAERFADYWIFGGIYRPVYLEIKPRQHIDWTAIDARADGSYSVDLYLSNIKSANRVSVRILDEMDEQVGAQLNHELDKKVHQVNLRSKISNILTWNPEFPNLYSAEINLLEDGKLVHTIKERFGFRTVEVKERDGIYVNGTKIKFKGVCRHSFWPETGRTLSKSLSIADVRLMKDMNMNAVRMSHYPPDSHFLDVCDSLGLFVLDELAGWQASYDTEIGKKLVREMIVRDVNHPSVVIWDNGNEGGWNTDLDVEFHNYDPQKRIVIHPYEKFGMTDTNHYIDYGYGSNDSFNGNHIFFPTEFLHGLFDGGHGAALEDYWNLMWETPISAGGFLWVFSDESVKRTDRNGVLDSDGNHAPDGILGPYREKEGSYYAIKEIWSPIFFSEKHITGQFNGVFDIENRYHFTNTDQCSFSFELVQFQDPDSQVSGHTVWNKGTISSPEIAPGGKGKLVINLPANWSDADALYITAWDPNGREVFTWDWPIHLPEKIVSNSMNLESLAQARGFETENMVVMEAANLKVEIEKTTGLLHQVTSDGNQLSISGGPVLTEGSSEFINYETRQNETSYEYKGAFKGNLKSITWTMFGNGIIRLNVVYVPDNHLPFYGVNFNYPEELVTGVKWLGDGPYRVWKNRLRGVLLDVWEKGYNNTITGESYLYPEFKGYYSNMYWAVMKTREHDFKFYTATENLYMRLYTPGDPVAEPGFTKVQFPDGDISFLHAINAIGTKFKSPEQLGPQSQLNMYSRHRTDNELNIELYFDFKK